LLFISDERDIESGRKLFVLATAECDSGPCSSAARPPPEQARWQATSAAAATATSPETGRAASGTGGSASPASSSHPATTNVSFRPRWLDHIFSSGQQHGSGTSAATTGGSDNDDVLLQSTGKPYDVSFLQRVDGCTLYPLFNPILISRLSSCSTFACASGFGSGHPGRKVHDGGRVLRRQRGSFRSRF
jgi:hypothetical protein